MVYTTYCQQQQQQQQQQQHITDMIPHAPCIGPHKHHIKWDQMYQKLSEVNTV
jgi:hypothetical protein